MGPRYRSPESVGEVLYRILDGAARESCAALAILCQCRVVRHCRVAQLFSGHLLAERLPPPSPLPSHTHHPKHRASGRRAAGGALPSCQSLLTPPTRSQPRPCNRVQSGPKVGPDYYRRDTTAAW